MSLKKDHRPNYSLCCIFVFICCQALGNTHCCQQTGTISLVVHCAKSRPRVDTQVMSRALQVTQMCSLILKKHKNECPLQFTFIWTSPNTFYILVHSGLYR